MVIAIQALCLMSLVATTAYIAVGRLQRSSSESNTKAISLGESNLLKRYAGSVILLLLSTVVVLEMTFSGFSLPLSSVLIAVAVAWFIVSFSMTTGFITDKRYADWMIQCLISTLLWSLIASYAVFTYSG